MRIIDGSSDVCSSDLSVRLGLVAARVRTVDHRPVSGMGVQDMTHLVQQNEDDARIEYFLRQRVDGRVRQRVVRYPQRPQRLRPAPEIALPPIFQHADIFEHGLGGVPVAVEPGEGRSEEHTSELQSLMRISYAVFCLKKKKIR